MVPVVPVAAGGGDNAAGAVGAGVIAPGDGFLSLGTSGVIFAVSDGFAPDLANGVHAFGHALPGRWHQMAVILSAASCLDWAARLGGFANVPTALSVAEALEDHAEVPVFLPYPSGERTPFNDAAARGVLFGMNHDTGGAQMVRAVMEGVAFALADGAESLRATRTQIETLSLIGGGARSAPWARILATALDCRLEVHAHANVGPAFGAVHLARLAVTGEAITEVCAPTLLSSVIEPDPTLATILAPPVAPSIAAYTPHCARPFMPVKLD